MALFSSILASLTSFIPGSRLVDGGDCQAMAQYLFKSTTGLVARAGGGAALATALSYGMNQVDTVASGSDSVILPAAIPGASVTVYNKGAQTMKVFGQQANTGGGLAAGDTITVNNSVTAAAVATGVDQASAVAAEYFCFALGQWKQLISA